jgi:hypothetical protein
VLMVAAQHVCVFGLYPLKEQHERLAPSLSEPPLAPVTTVLPQHECVCGLKALVPQHERFAPVVYVFMQMVRGRYISRHFLKW